MDKSRIPYISHENIKTGMIPVINLPAGETCRADAPCFKKCYALRQYNYRSNNLAAHRRNLTAYKDNPRAFFEFVASNTAFERFCRWFGAGDIVDAEFFAGMVRVARKNKGTRYLAFTKKFEIVNDYVANGGKIPSNLTIIFSGWGAKFAVLNPYNFPRAFTRFKNNEADNADIPVDAFPCAGKCSQCVACWRLKKGEAVVFDEH